MFIFVNVLPSLYDIEAVLNHEGLLYCGAMSKFVEIACIRYASTSKKVQHIK